MFLIVVYVLKMSKYKKYKLDISLDSAEANAIIEPNNKAENESITLISNLEDQEANLEQIKIFQNLIKNAKSSGENSISGEATELPVLPGLHIDNFGSVLLPFTKETAEKLIQICKQAPYGHNHETLIDTNVRDTYQLEPSLIKIKNTQWKRGLNKLVHERVAKGLGCHGEIEAKLYKLLVYKPGGHFKKVN